MGIVVRSNDTLSEFTQTFARPKFDKYVDPLTRHHIVSVFEKKSFLIEVTIQINECRDKKDNKFLELAVTPGADCIITGDKDLLVLHPFHNIPILNAADFI